MSISDYVSIRHKHSSNLKTKKVYRLRFSRSLDTGAVTQLNTVQNRYDDVLQSRSLLSLFLILYDIFRDYYSIARFNAIEIN